MLANLIGNALQYGQPGAPVSVTLDAAAADQVVVTVHNRGAIPAEVIPHLFDPFRVRQKQVNGSRGLGLGLYIVREIVQAHGGRVDVCSTEAAGTAFVVTLPRQATRPAEPPAASDADADADAEA